MVERRSVFLGMRAHPFVTLLVVSVLVGGGLRFVPSGAAASTGSSGGGAGSTACAAS